jgi:hypothetical protein
MSAAKAITFERFLLDEVPVATRATTPLPFPWADALEDARKNKDKTAGFVVPDTFWVEARGVEASQLNDRAVVRSRIKASWQSFRASWEAANRGKFIGFSILVSDNTNSRGAVDGSLVSYIPQLDADRKALIARAANIRKSVVRGKKSK